MGNRSLHYLIGFVGMTGFAISILLLVSRSPLINVGTGSVPAVVVFVMICCFLMFLMVFTNDILAKPQGLSSLYILAAFGGVGGTLLLHWIMNPLVVLPFISLGIISAMALWLLFLSSLAHRILILLSSLSLVLCGMFFLTLIEVPSSIDSILIVIFLALSLVCAIILRPDRISASLLVSRKESGAHNTDWVKNRYTLFALGFIMGASGYLILYLGFDESFNGLVFGIGLAASGFVTLILRMSLRSVFEGFALRSVAVFTTLGLLPIPFLMPYGQAVFAGIFFFWAVTNLIILINAVAETARQSIISPLWIMGKEGSICLLGISLSLLLFWWGFSVSTGSLTQLFVCLGTVVFTSLLQISIDKKKYPFLSERNLASDSVSVQDPQTPEQKAQQEALWKAIWHVKLDAIAKEYELSPRQKEIMELLVKGRDSRYIMNNLYISRSTAKAHIYNIYKKMAVHSRQELIDIVEQAIVTTEQLPIERESFNAYDVDTSEN